MDCQACRTNLTAYLDQEMSSVETEQMLQHLTSCAECAAEAQSLSEVAWMVEEAIQPVDLSESVWTGIAVGIRPTPRAQARRRTGASIWEMLLGSPLRGFASAAAGLLLVAASALVLWQPSAPSSQQSEQLKMQFNSVMDQMEKEENQPHGLTAPAQAGDDNNPFSEQRASNVAGTSLRNAKSPTIRRAPAPAPALNATAPFIEASETETRESR